MASSEVKASKAPETLKEISVASVSALLSKAKAGDLPEISLDGAVLKLRYSPELHAARVSADDDALKSALGASLLDIAQRDVLPGVGPAAPTQPSIPTAGPIAFDVIATLKA